MVESLKGLCPRGSFCCRVRERRERREVQCWFLLISLSLLIDCLILTTTTTTTSPTDGTSYEGEWLDGDFHGNGKLTLADGTILEGQFVLGRTHGKVTVVHKDGHTREAHFDNGVPVAQQ